MSEQSEGEMYWRGYNAALDIAAKIIEAKLPHYDGAYERLLVTVREVLRIGGVASCIGALGEKPAKPKSK